MILKYMMTLQVVALHVLKRISFLDFFPLKPVVKFYLLKLTVLCLEAMPSTIQNQNLY